MSVPCGPDQFPDLDIHTQLAAFERAIRDYADARLEAANLQAEIDASGSVQGLCNVDRVLLQRQVDAAQREFVAKETIASFALVLSAHNVFVRCATIYALDPSIHNGMRASR